MSETFLIYLAFVAGQLSVIFVFYSGLTDLRVIDIGKEKRKENIQRLKRLFKLRGKNEVE